MLFARAVLVNRARGCESCLGAFGRALLVLLNDVATGIENVSCTLWNADLRGMLCVWHRSQEVGAALPSVLQDASAQNAGTRETQRIAQIGAFAIKFVAISKPCSRVWQESPWQSVP